MANAQILLVVRGLVSAEALRSAVETAGRAGGFVAGPSTYASGSSTAIRQGVVGTFSAGPWLGFEFPGETLPSVPSNVEWSAIRMNLLDGRDGSEALTLVGNALLAMPSVIRMASRGPRNAISWDRGVPAALPLSEASSPGARGGGFLLGLTVVAGLAWLASRGAR